MAKFKLPSIYLNVALRPQNLQQLTALHVFRNKYDHPFELMAYEVSTILSDKIYGTL